jgi:hypothetical protein
MPFEAFLIPTPRKWSISSRKIHRSHVVSICGPLWPFERRNLDSIIGALPAMGSALISLVLQFYSSMSSSMNKFAKKKSNQFQSNFQIIKIWKINFVYSLRMAALKGWWWL